MKFTALIKFIRVNKGRTKPINIDCYIPQIKVGANSYVSSAIKGKGKKILDPGEELQVEMYVPKISNLSKGQVLTFWEPPIKIGEITVIDIIEEA